MIDIFPRHLILFEFNSYSDTSMFYLVPTNDCEDPHSSAGAAVAAGDLRLQVRTAGL